MSSSLSSSSIKQGPGYCAAPVFGWGGSGAGEKFGCAGSAPDRLVRRVARRPGSGRIELATSTARFTGFQVLSGGGDRQVAWRPSHGWAGIADFRASRADGCLIASYRTVRDLLAIQRRARRMAGPNGGTGRRGGCPLRAIFFPPYAGPAGQPSFGQKPGPALLRSADREQTLPAGEVAESGIDPMGSGVSSATKSASASSGCGCGRGGRLAQGDVLNGEVLTLGSGWR